MVPTAPTGTGQGVRAAPLLPGAPGDPVSPRGRVLHGARDPGTGRRLPLRPHECVWFSSVRWFRLFMTPPLTSRRLCGNIETMGFELLPAAGRRLPAPSCPAADGASPLVSVSLRCSSPLETVGSSVTVTVISDNSLKPIIFMGHTQCVTSAASARKAVGAASWGLRDPTTHVRRAGEGFAERSSWRSGKNQSGRFPREPVHGAGPGGAGPRPPKGGARRPGTGAPGARGPAGGLAPRSSSASEEVTWNRPAPQRGLLGAPAGAGRRSVLPATTRQRRPRGAGHVNPPPLPAFVSPGRVGAGPREAQVLAGGEHWELVPVAMAEGTGGVTWGADSACQASWAMLASLSAPGLGRRRAELQLPGWWTPDSRHGGAASHPEEPGVLVPEAPGRVASSLALARKP